MEKSENMKGFIKENIFWIFVFIILMAIIPFVIKFFSPQVKAFDSFIYNLFAGYRTPALTQFFRVITHFGGPILIIAVCLCALILVRKKQYAYLVIGSTAIAFIVNQLMKNLIERKRPNVLRLSYESSYSFPSGHSMASMALYGYMIYLVQTHIKTPIIKWLLSIILSVLILLIGASRIYLGVHYASDVIYGFVVSYVLLVMFIHLTKKYAE